MVVQQRLNNIPLDCAGENTSTEVNEVCLRNGIAMEMSPPFVPQSNGVAERFMQELGMRARVLLLSAKLPNSLWAEVMSHTNSLRNPLPADSVNGQIPILLWDSRPRINWTIPSFRQARYAFLYQSATRANRKYSARSARDLFVGMERNETLSRIFLSTSKKIIITRRQDFGLCSQDKLPGVASLLDGISRQRDIDPNQHMDGIEEDLLTQAYAAYFSSCIIPDNSPHAMFAKQNLQDYRLPRNFQEETQSKV